MRNSRWGRKTKSSFAPEQPGLYPQQPRNRAPLCVTALGHQKDQFCLLTFSSPFQSTWPEIADSHTKQVFLHLLRSKSVMIGYNHEIILFTYCGCLLFFLVCSAFHWTTKTRTWYSNLKPIMLYILVLGTMDIRSDDEILLCIYSIYRRIVFENAPFIQVIDFVYNLVLVYKSSVCTHDDIRIDIDGRRL